MPQTKKMRLGEMLIEKGLINATQLSNALKQSNQTGIKLGASLIGLEYVTEDQILKTLSESLNVPFIDISKNVISTKTQLAFPYEFVKKYRVIPIGFANRQLVAAMEDPTDYVVIKDIQFKAGFRIKPVLASSYQVNELIKFFEQSGYGKKPCNLAQLKQVEIKMKTMKVDDLLLELVKLDGSDLHLTVGAPPSVRVNNKITRLNLPIVNSQIVIKFASELLTDDQKRELIKNKEIEIAYMKGEIGRFRIVIYRQRRSLSICARSLKAVIPPLDSLGLPPVLEKLAAKRQGLILITSPAGHGKTTTVAAIINLINERYSRNIITLEDPIEYLHRHKRSNVNQREIGEDTESFTTGLKHIYKQNPDVIMIGELRDPASISIAMMAATTGHLVLTTLNTMDTSTAIDTILNYFPGESQNIIRNQFADALTCIVAQRLIPKKTGSGRALAYEVMYNSSRVSNLIRDGKAHQIKTQTTTAKGGDVEAMEYSLVSLYQRGVISYEDALSYAENEHTFNNLISVHRSKK